MRVLLIEDEPTTAKAIEMMLVGEGFKMDCTDLGEEGLDLGRLYDYDLILHASTVIDRTNTGSPSSTVPPLTRTGSYY